MNNTKIKKYCEYFSIAKSIMRADLKLMIKQLKGKILDAAIWGGISLFVMAYLMPSNGLLNFGPFQAPTIIIGGIGFATYGQMFLLTMEMEKRSHLFYLFTLPIPRGIIFAQKMLFYTINGLVIGLSMIPICKLVLGSQLQCAANCWPKMILVILVSSLLFSGFMLIMTSIVKTTQNVDHVFMRVFFPMWFIGGYQFSWAALNKINKIISYVALFTPYVYAHEAARGAMLGPKGFLPFWLCIGVLFSASIVFSIIGYYKIRKYLDLSY